MWRDDYLRTPEGEKPVYMSEHGGPLTYYAIRKVFLEVVGDVNSKKR